MVTYITWHVVWRWLVTYHCLPEYCLRLVTYRYRLAPSHRSYKWNCTLCNHQQTSPFLTPLCKEGHWWNSWRWCLDFSDTIYCFICFLTLDINCLLSEIVIVLNFTRLAISACCTVEAFKYWECNVFGHSGRENVVSQFIYLLK